jgi:hypothetical protein
MNKHEELFKLIKENPELEIVPMVDSEVVSGDDYSSWMGAWGKSRLDEYYCGDERIYFGDDKEDLMQELIDNNYDNKWEGKTDEEMETMAKEIVNGYEWIKCIAVRIETP